MNEPTSRDIAKALFWPTGEPGERFRVLVNVVMDLMMEVEAIRVAMTAKADYSVAYRETGLLSHDSSGPSMGWDKLLGRYYPADKDPHGRVWRETLMLHRLGFSEEEIERYRRDAQGMEACT